MALGRRAGSLGMAGRGPLLRAHAARGTSYLLVRISDSGYGENAGIFVGIVAVALALIAIAISWRQPAVKLFSAVALGGLIYSLGANSIFQGFIYAVVPFVEKARVPAMATLLFDVGIAVLAAFGVDALQPSGEPAEQHARWIRRISLGVAAFGIVTGVIVMALLLGKQFHWDFDDRVVITAVVAILMPVLMYSWWNHGLTRRQAVTLLTLLLLFEVANQTTFDLADRNDPERRKFLDKAWNNGDIADFLTATPALSAWIPQPMRSFAIGAISITSISPPRKPESR